MSASSIVALLYVDNLNGCTACADSLKKYLFLLDWMPKCLRFNFIV
jgi:hypothetical protein